MTNARHPAGAGGAFPRAARLASRAAVQNPMLTLPVAAALLRLNPDVRTAVRDAPVKLAHDARGRADESWRRHKAPMAAYWKAVAVHADPLAQVRR